MTRNVFNVRAEEGAVECQHTGIHRRDNLFGVFENGATEGRIQYNSDLQRRKEISYPTWAPFIPEEYF